MSIGPEAWLVVFAAAAIGIAGMLLTLAAAIRRNMAIIDLEVRVRHLRAEQRQRMIERGLIEPEEGEVIEVDAVDDLLEVEPIEDQPEPVAQPKAA